MFLEIVLLLVGFTVLIKGADFLVSGSSSIAKKYNISNIAIGLTVVAFGTSTPELMVSGLSAVNGRADASFGNVIGSNNFNVMFILGIAGLIYPLVVQRNTIRFEVPLSLLAALILYILVNDIYVWGSAENLLSRWDALLLLCFFGSFAWYVYNTMKSASDDQGQPIKLYTNPVAIIFVVLGIGMLLLGGSLAVNSSVAIAQYYGLSEKLIGLTILATGTSLPELATSAVAAYRKNTDIAIGNVVGSNIFNITLILGVTGLIRPISYNDALNFDLEIFGASSIVLMIFMFTINQRKLDRWEALILLTGYITYLMYMLAHDAAQ